MQVATIAVYAVVLLTVALAGWSAVRALRYGRGSSRAPTPDPSVLAHRYSPRLVRMNAGHLFTIRSDNKELLRYAERMGRVLGIPSPDLSFDSGGELVSLDVRARLSAHLAECRRRLEGELDDLAQRAGKPINRPSEREWGHVNFCPAGWRSYYRAEDHPALYSRDPATLPEGDLEAIRLESLRWLFPPTDDLPTLRGRNCTPVQVPEADARYMLARLKVPDPVTEAILEAAGLTEASVPNLKLASRG